MKIGEAIYKDTPAPESDNVDGDAEKKEKK